MSLSLGLWSAWAPVHLLPQLQPSRAMNVPLGLWSGSVPVHAPVASPAEVLAVVLKPG